VRLPMAQKQGRLVELTSWEEDEIVLEGKTKV
jgi:hypothetical protein